MAAQDRPTSNKDLESIAPARALASAARQAQSQLAELSQEQIDAIVAAMADAVTPQAEALARLAVEETGYGGVREQSQENPLAPPPVPRFHKADADRRCHQPDRRPEDRRDRRALRRRRRHRPFDQS